MHVEAIPKHLWSSAGLWTIALMVPGPNFLLIVHTAASKGRSASIAVGFGCALGTSVWVVGSLFGLALIFSMYPALLTAVRLAGAAYLVFIGIGMTLRNGTTPGEVSCAPNKGTAESFRRGLSTTLGNPKTIAFMSSVFAASMNARVHRLSMLPVLLTMIGTSTLWYVALALYASRSAFSQAYARVQRQIRKGAGLIFMLFGLKLAFAR